MNKNNSQSATLLIHCVDRQGIVALITDFIYKNKGNIIYLDQHVDARQKVFFMRAEWDMAGFLIPPEQLRQKFQEEIADKLELQWQIHFSGKKLRMAVLVSKLSHCLYDILSQYQSGTWNVEIPLIISNHPDLENVAAQFGLPFHVFPITKENKADQEKKQMELLKKHNIDFVVLARYMQILTDNFVSQYFDRIINIHHSFLPAFPGAKPYHSAFERGVKIIGATSHYVTSELDTGPIIQQDIVRVTHRDAVKDLIRKGRDLEKLVLSRAIWYHLQHKILVYNNRTVIFD